MNQTIQDTTIPTSTRNYMLTSIDNPYDPYTQFDLWYGFDTSTRVIEGSRVEEPISSRCCEKLAEEAITSYDMTDEEYAYEVKRAVDEIIKNDTLKIYKRAYAPE